MGIRDTVTGIFKSRNQIEIEAKHSVVETVRDKLVALDAEIAAAEQRRRELALNLVLDDNPEAVEHLLDEAQRLAARRQLLADALAAAEAQQREAEHAEQIERDRRAVERQAEQRRGADRALAQHLGRFQAAHREVEKVQAALDKACADLDAARGAAVAVLPGSLPREYRLPSGHYLGDLWGADTLTRPLVNEVMDAVRQIGREQLGLVEPPAPPPPPAPGPWEADPDFDDEVGYGPELPGYDYELIFQRTGFVSAGTAPSWVVENGEARPPTAAEAAEQTRAGPRFEVIGRKRRLRAVTVKLKPAAKPNIALPVAQPVSVEPEAEPAIEPETAVEPLAYTPDPWDPLVEMARAGGRHDFQRPAVAQESAGAPEGDPVADDDTDDTDAHTASLEAPEIALPLDGTLVEPASSTGLGGGATPNLEDF